MKELVVEKVLNGRLFELCYLAHDKDDNKCICVDPGYEVDRILRYIDNNNLVVDTILLTHAHFDHSLGCYELQKKFNCKVYVSKEDEEILYNAEYNCASLLNINNCEKFDTLLVSDNDTLELLGHRIKCINTPGHTKGGMSYYFEDDKVLFSGDTLFCRTYGRVDLYGGNFLEITDSIINKLFKLPDDVIVYPGHGESTTIGDEKIHNEIKGDNYEL